MSNRISVGVDHSKNFFAINGDGSKPCTVVHMKIIGTYGCSSPEDGM
jgi:hypothetical protein